MNFYATLESAKRAAGAVDSSRDTLWLEKLDAASRAIDLFCGRHFFTVEGVRYFDGACRFEVWIDDFLSISALGMDTERDGTFDGESWVEGQDWISRPYNAWPKIGIEMHVAGRYGMVSGRRYIKATGIWGYGDGQGASPWRSVALTGTVADDSATSLTLSGEGTIETGATIKIEDEQLFIESITEGAATVVRGVNGTTAAAHTDAAISSALYPAVVIRACATLAVSMVTRDGKAAYKSERIGDYGYTLSDFQEDQKFLGRALGGLVRPV